MAGFLHGVEVIEVLDGKRPLQTARSSVIGLIGTAPLADAAKFPLNTPVLVSSAKSGADLGADGTLKDALDGIYDQVGALVVVVRVDEGVDETATLANVVGDAATGTGVHAFLNAASTVKVAPSILVAMGWSHQRPAAAANPVVAELKGIATKLRATIVADGPNTTDAEAITAAGEASSDRVYLVEPWVTVFDTVTASNVAQPASARIAGLIALRDHEVGFWASPSNQVINGIVGVSRPIQFSMSDSTAQSNLLNEAKVATIVFQDGYRLWGNRGTGADPLTAFLAVRRNLDVIDNTMEAGFLWGVAKPFSSQLILDIEDSINAKLGEFFAKGATLGRSVWLDRDLNTAASMLSGRFYFDMDTEPPAPLERMTIRRHRNAGYYGNLVDQVLAT
jgi:phage tail sheath protein FI